MRWNRSWAALPLLAALLLTACSPTPGQESASSSAGSSASQSAQSGDPAGSGVQSFAFTRENLPRLDGSTSTVPLAKAMCGVLLGEDPEATADLVDFSRTTQSYRNLMAGERDLVLAAEPDPEVLEQLKGEEKWLMTPFATDALVFVVNQDNPVDSLTTEQVQKIYTGEITNWKEVGGEDLDIVPFQRNQGAGSQAMFEKLVMGGLTPMEAPSAWIPNSMMGLIEAVRSYDGSPAAIGYTVYYYANDMEMARGLKVLSIDGVTPTADTIRSGEYPFLNPYYVAIAKDAAMDSPTRILYDWVLGSDGQKLAQMEGYVPVTGQEE